jgi:glycosyltransferase involved in cell wall biosynthesis
MLIDFCIPIYNEARILEDNIIKLRSYLETRPFSFNWRIVIINNGSTDGTAAICGKIKSEKTLIENISDPGKGRALKTYWTKSPADIIVYMDIDLAVSLDDTDKILDPLIKEGFDMAIGSRLHPDSVINRSIARELSSQAYNALSRYILGHKFKDLQCGFKAIRSDVLKKVLPQILDNRWFFDTELVVFAHHYGFKIKEVGVDWEENRYEVRKSKVNLFKDSLIFIINLFKLKLRLAKLDD